MNSNGEGVSVTEVSVIVPMCNCEMYLAKCVSSLVNQEFEDYEVILVDDCSSDNTLELAHRLQKAHPAVVRAIQRNTNGGAGGARNTGIQRADGAWLMFVDSDDWVSTDYISALYETANSRRADYAMCEYTLVFPRGQRRVVHADPRLTDQADKSALMAMVPSSACLKIYRRELFDRIRFLEKVQQEDLGIAAPIISMAKRAAILRAPLYFYRQRAGSTEHTFRTQYTDDRIKNLGYLSGFLNAFPEVIEFLYVRELLGYRTSNLLARRLPIEDTWRYLEERFPRWRDNSLSEYMPARLSRQIRMIDDGYLNRTRLEILVRRFYSRLRGV